MAGSMVFITAIITPIVKLIYKPSRKYRSSNKRRTIQHSRLDAELRLLACIHHQENTPSIIGLLEVSNPSIRSAVCFYVVHLLELAGRSSPLLIAHRQGRRNNYITSQSDHMIQAFRLYEQQNQGVAVVNMYTAMSPYASMQDEICSLAMDKRVSMVIVPFHKQLTFNGVTNMFANQIRTVNRHILRIAPCSVGILVDRGTLNNSISGSTKKEMCRIGVIFLGGCDDREALAYSMRMAEHPNIAVTVIHIVEATTNSTTRQSGDDKLDYQILNEFRIVNNLYKQHVYREELVNDSVGVVNAIRSIEGSHDLILVGRRHEEKLELFTGLTDWNEFPELGFIGDMLASSDSECSVSVLVVQQHTLGGDDDVNILPKAKMWN